MSRTSVPHTPTSSSKSYLGKDDWSPIRTSQLFLPRIAISISDNPKQTSNSNTERTNNVSSRAGSHTRDQRPHRHHLPQPTKEAERTQWRPLLPPRQTYEGSRGHGKHLHHHLDRKRPLLFRVRLTPTPPLSHMTDTKIAVPTSPSQKHRQKTSISNATTSKASWPKTYTSHMPSTPTPRS
jgi:hypothetical protein